MEMREIYTRDCVPTGRIVPKHTPLKDGEYFLHAIVILRTPDGRYIMQQRSLKARWYAGMWDVTGGGVSAGESSRDAAVREAFEELGVVVSPADCRLIFREVTDWPDEPGGLITETWFADVEVPQDGFRIEEREVNAVKLVSYDEFAETVSYNKSEGFMDALRMAERG